MSTPNNSELLRDAEANEAAQVDLVRMRQDNAKRRTDDVRGESLQSVEDVLGALGIE